MTALKYWWLFFRRQAFTGFLDELLQQSADYAKGLGERLKDRTFTSIFPQFAEGFIQQLRSDKTDKSDKSAFTDEALNSAFTATMTFLYRLMFLLYAESLGLLPVIEERGYGELSLRQLKKELAEAGGAIEDEAPKRLAARYKADSTALYERLQRLFKAIDAGDAALNLPMYNGGLFSAATPEGRFLAEHAIPDRYLALGLDRLCRDVDDKTQALALIDYKSLGVRQLGSIYEGLLEFKLRIAAEPLVVVKEKGKEVYLPAKEAGGKRPVATLAKGDVYLENDKRERKATGSYYTPDYIVKYIVEHTVGPVLERKFEALAPRLREAQKLYRERKKLAEAKHEDPEKFWNNDRDAAPGRRLPGRQSAGPGDGQRPFPGRGRRLHLRPADPVPQRLDFEPGVGAARADAAGHPGRHGQAARQHRRRAADAACRCSSARCSNAASTAWTSTPWPWSWPRSACGWTPSPWARR